jgi:hypothetical protein
MESIGCMIAQRITSLMTGYGLTYEQVCKLVYGELDQIATEQVNGDWLEMPNGDTYTKTYTVDKKGTK